MYFYVSVFPDDQINDVSQQSLVSALDGNKSQDLHLSLRLSVCEGVKVMYNKYQDKKWSQVKAFIQFYLCHYIIDSTI